MKRIFLLVLAVVVIGGFGFNATAQNSIRSNGKPFQALQDQIDGLQQQIDEIELKLGPPGEPGPQAIPFGNEFYTVADEPAIERDFQSILYDDGYCDNGSTSGLAKPGIAMELPFGTPIELPLDFVASQ